MTNLHESAPHKRPEITRILLYLGVTIATSFVFSLLQSFASRLLINILMNLLGLSATVLSIFQLLLSIVMTTAFCIVLGLLYRQFVFRSIKSPTPAIVVIVILSILRLLLVFVINLVLSSFILSRGMNYTNQYTMATTAVSFIATWGSHVIFYLIQRFGFYGSTLDTLNQ